jgi:hypothetical protein
MLCYLQINTVHVQYQPDISTIPWLYVLGAYGWMACGFYNRPRMVGWPVGSTAGRGWLPKTGWEGGAVFITWT